MLLLRIIQNNFRLLGCAKSWAFFSQKFLRIKLRFHFLRSVKLGKWVAGTTTPGLHRR